ncbi:MAG: choice-of-anchor D domain-containing protein, partial [Pirellulales bacterium]
MAIADDTGLVDFGTGLPFQTVNKTFTISNAVGSSEPLTIQEPAMPAGFTLVSFDGQTPTGGLTRALNGGQSTTMVVRMDGGALGPLSGEISLVSDDPDENPFNFQVTSQMTATQAIDNSDAGFNESGPWQFRMGHGYLNDDQLIFSQLNSTLASSASWNFTGLADGNYEVSVTFDEGPFEAASSVSPYTVTDSNGATTLFVNQKHGPADFMDDGEYWQRLGSFTVSGGGGTITVGLTNDVDLDTRVFADAVRIERIVDPQANVTDTTGGGSTVIVDDEAAVNFGATGIGAPAQRTFAISNTGERSLGLGAITLPDGFSVVGTFPSAVPAGGTAAVTLQMDAAAKGSFGGEVSFRTDDSDSSPFDFNVSGIVGSLIIDNLDPQFAVTGSGWSAPFTGQGHANSVQFHATGAGSNAASWTFDGLMAGQTYEVLTTWTSHANRATDAPFSLYDGDPLPANLAVTKDLNQALPPDDDSDEGTLWETVGQVATTGTRVTVTLTDDANKNVIADAVWLRAVVGSEIRLLDGATELFDETSTVNFGSATTKTFTVSNSGVSPLTLSGITLPNDFSLVGALPGPVAVGASATFQVQFSGLPGPTVGGELALVSDDADESPFQVQLLASIPDPVAIIDDGAAGYTGPGFTTFAFQGYQDDVRFSAAGSGNTATWTFNLAALGLPTTGDYRVATTWTEHANRASNAPYTVLDNAAPFAPVSINQELAPNDFSDDGVNWEHVGTFNITSGTLGVKLTDVGANEYVIADAIRIELITSEADIEVRDGGVVLNDDASVVNFGITGESVTLTRQFALHNSGDANLEIQDITLPSGFTLLTDPSPVTIAAGGGPVTFDVRYDAATPGVTSGQVTINNNDSDESPFDFFISGEVFSDSAIIVDNGGSGFAAGGFTPFASQGYLGDVHYSGKNAGNTATWTFDNLVPGNYQVAANWVAHPNRATNAPYTVLDSNGVTVLASASINQELAPDDFSDQGVLWGDLGSVTITGTQLTV